MKRSLLIFFFFGTALTVAQTPTAPPRTLTLQDALNLLRTSSPALMAARSHQSAVQAAEITAAVRPNPVASLANEDFRVFNPSRIDVANAQEFTDNVAWTIERGGKRPARIASARAATQVGVANVADTLRQLEFAVRVAFVNVLAGKEVLALADTNLRDYRKTLEANQLRLQTGDISQTDFDRLKVQEAQFMTDLLNARAAVAQAKAQLAAPLGIQDPLSIDVSGSLVVAPALLSFDDVQRNALANRPDYLAAVRTVTKNQADLRLAHANGATDVTIAPEYKRNGPDNTMGVTVSMPLRIFDRNQGEKRRAAYELESSRFAAEATRAQVLSDVAQAWQAYQAAVERSRLYTGDYLQRARDVRDRMTFSYKHGATNLLEYLDAVRSYRDVELAAVNANAALLIALHQLSAASATEVLP